MAVTDEDISKKSKNPHQKKQKYTKQPEFLVCISLTPSMGSSSLQVLLNTSCCGICSDSAVTLQQVGMNC